MPENGLGQALRQHALPACQIDCNRIQGHLMGNPQIDDQNAIFNEIERDKVREYLKRKLAHASVGRPQKTCPG